MSAAENAAIVRRIFDAFARKEGLALRGLFAEDAVWSVPGHGVMAGLRRTRGDLPVPREAAEGDGRDVRLRAVDVLASDDRAAALYRARGTRHGRTLELDQVLLFRIEDGLVRHVLALPSDPDAFEAFWA